MSPDIGHLRDMARSAQIALSHVGGMTLDAFLVDVKTQDAVLWRLALIGEQRTMSAQARVRCFRCHGRKSSA